MDSGRCRPWFCARDGVSGARSDNSHQAGLAPVPARAAVRRRFSAVQVVAQGHNAPVTTAELQRLAAELGLDAIGATRAEAYTGTERHIRERRARGLFGRMRFTMARPEVSCHPEALLDGARTVVSAALCYYAPEPPRPRGPRPAAALHLARPLRRPAREARRARPPARWRVPRAGRREPARRPRGGRAFGCRLLRQEHDGAHAPSRLMGRARNARDHGRARAHRAARSRLRLVHALHRRLPDRRARRGGRARRDAMPFVLDAGARARPGAVPRGARRAGLRLRHLPGRLSVEPRRRAAARGARAGHRRPRRSGRVARGRRARARGRGRPPVRAAQRRALAAAQRAGRARQRGRRASRGRARPSSGTRPATTSCWPSTRGGRSRASRSGAA